MSREAPGCGRGLTLYFPLGMPAGGDHARQRQQRREGGPPHAITREKNQGVPALKASLFARAVSRRGFKLLELH